MACNNAEDSVINFDAAPAWLHEGKDLGKPLRDPTGRELGEWISRILSWCKLLPRVLLNSCIDISLHH